MPTIGLCSWYMKAGNPRGDAKRENATITVAFCFRLSLQIRFELISSTTKHCFAGPHRHIAWSDPRLAATLITNRALYVGPQTSRNTWRILASGDLGPMTRPHREWSEAPRSNGRFAELWADYMAIHVYEEKNL
jgi:hypothetical protein